MQARAAAQGPGTEPGAIHAATAVQLRSAGSTVEGGKYALLGQRLPTFHRGPKPLVTFDLFCTFTQKQGYPLSKQNHNNISMAAVDSREGVWLAM